VRLTLALILILFQVTAHADSLTGRVVRVSDGDTIVILDADVSFHPYRAIPISP
jgi:endonuclease YncB( thermonuclease family)